MFVIASVAGGIVGDVKSLIGIGEGRRITVLAPRAFNSGIGIPVGTGPRYTVFEPACLVSFVKVKSAADGVCSTQSGTFPGIPGLEMGIVSAVPCHSPGNLHTLDNFRPGVRRISTRWIQIIIT
jgi:hypothetical protein